MEVAIVALPMTLIIITGEIDLSVESMIGLSGADPRLAVGGRSARSRSGSRSSSWWERSAGSSTGCSSPGSACRRWSSRSARSPCSGAWRTSSWGRPRVSNFPGGFTAFGFGNVPGTPIPWTLIVFAVLGVVFYLVAHRTWIGRQVFAVGRNKDAARYSGVRVGTLKAALFVLSGMVAAFAGVILTSRFSSARADNGTGLTLIVVTIVLLGGVDINGGKGTITGVILAVFTLAVLQNALRLAGVSSEIQASPSGSS